MNPSAILAGFAISCGVTPQQAAAFVRSGVSALTPTSTAEYELFSTNNVVIACFTDAGAGVASTPQYGNSGARVTLPATAAKVTVTFTAHTSARGRTPVVEDDSGRNVGVLLTLSRVTAADDTVAICELIQGSSFPLVATLRSGEDGEHIGVTEFAGQVLTVTGLGEGQVLNITGVLARSIGVDQAQVAAAYARSSTIGDPQARLALGDVMRSAQSGRIGRGMDGSMQMDPDSAALAVGAGAHAEKAVKGLFDAMKTHGLFGSKGDAIGNTFKANIGGLRRKGGALAEVGKARPHFDPPTAPRASNDGGRDDVEAFSAGAERVVSLVADNGDEVAAVVKDLTRSGATRKRKKKGHKTEEEEVVYTAYSSGSATRGSSKRSGTRQGYTS